MPISKEVSEDLKLVYVAMISIKKYLLPQHQKRAESIIRAARLDFENEAIHLKNYLIPSAFKAEDTNHESPVTNHGDCKEPK